MTMIDEAIYFVTDAMSGKIRKGDGSPAVFHSLEAGAIASSLTHDNEIISAVLLHDVIEDTKVTVEQLRKKFGDRVTQLVLVGSENKRIGIPPAESWKIRKEEEIEILKDTQDIGVKILFLADKLSNLRSVAVGLQRKGEAYWQNFNQKDPKEHYWYYSKIGRSLKVLQDTPEYKEYDRLLKAVFEGDQNE